MNLSAPIPLALGVRRLPAERAFTLVEVALSLAIVAFAMVAIIGVMPAGLNVQKENREDTILSQDAALLLEAIRSGANSAGVSALSSGFLGITGASVPPPGTNYTPLDIISRLSIPRWDTANATNLVRVHFRALSGNLGDSASAATAVAFNYIVTAEVTNYFGDPYQPGHNAFLTNNLFEVKLTFAWPVYESVAGQFPTNVGDRRLVVRSLVSGQLVTNGSGGRLFRGTSYSGL